MILVWHRSREITFWTIAQLTAGTFPRDRTPLVELSAFPPQGPDQTKFWGRCFTPLEVPAQWVVLSEKSTGTLKSGPGAPTTSDWSSAHSNLFQPS